MLKTTILMLLLFCGIGYADNAGINVISNMKTGEKLLLKDEKIIEALQFFTKELETASANKNNNAISENMYWMAECIFQLRQMKALEAILKIGKEFTKQHHLSSEKLKLTESKYLIDIGKNKEAIQLLLSLENENPEKYILYKEKLILADAYYRIGELNKCRNLFEFIIKNTADSTQIAQAYNGLGSYFFMLSDFDSAKLYYNRALELYKNTTGLFHTKPAAVIYNLALIADKNSDYQTSEKNILFSLKVYQTRFGEFHPKTAEAYGTLGSIYLMKEDIGKSVFYSLKECEILERIYGSENEKLIYSSLNLGKIYFATRDFPKAESEIRKALLLVEKNHGKRHNLYTQCIVKLSELLIQKGDYLQTEKLLKEVIEINKKNPDDYIPDCYFQLGCCYLKQKKYNDAVSNFKKSNEMYINFYGDKNIYSIEPLTEISNIFLQQKNSAIALKYANQALALTLDNNKIIYPYDHWECVLQILKCKKEMYRENLFPVQDCKKDIELIKQTLKEANDIRQTYYSSGSQMHYSEKIAELNEIGIYYLTHFYKKTDAYFLDNLILFSENNKANLLRNKISNNASTEILPEEERERLTLITTKLNHFISINENQEITAYNINDSILYYQSLFESFSKTLEIKYPKIYAIKYGQKPLNIKQIQDKLKEDYSFLVYCNDGENYYCFTISKKHIIYKICGNKNIIDAIVHFYLSKIINKNFDRNLNLQLSKILLPETLSENLIISSDNQLQHVSFDALYENQSCEYLVYKHTIQNTFSVSTYFDHPKTKNNKNIIAFFPDFTNTIYARLESKKEQNSLASFTNYQLFNNAAATKNTFLNTYNNAAIIHIASHLIIDTVSPLESAILFQPNDNYLMTINEIWKLSTNTQLVTLAACQSNYGKTQNGEGIQNFAWAFHYAGAHNILSTQWNASDKSTSIITSDFYKNLKSGKKKEKALQLAKINYLKNTDAIGAQPYFWANYSLFSDETTLNISSNFLVKYWWIPVLVLLLCYLAMVTYRKVYIKKSYGNI